MAETRESVAEEQDTVSSAQGEERFKVQGDEALQTSDCFILLSYLFDCKAVLSIEYLNISTLLVFVKTKTVHFKLTVGMRTFLSLFVSICGAVLHHHIYTSLNDLNGTPER